MANALLYVGTQGASYRPYGVGCAGSLGVPSLSATTGSLPMLGSTFSLTVANMPQNLGIVLLGFSDALLGRTVPLPLSLTPLGMVGCNLLTDINTTVVVSGGTSATWLLPVPNFAALIGALFYNQALVLDTAANAAGLTASNGGRGRIGL
jgi:hypothetical protein